MGVGWCWRGSSARGVRLLESMCRRSSFGICPLQKFDQSLISVGVWIRSTCNRSSGWKSDSRRSPDEVYLQSDSGMKSDSHRSPDEVYLQLESGSKSGSRRSLDEVFLQLESGMKSGSCRSLDEVYL